MWTGIYGLAQNRHVSHASLCILSIHVNLLAYLQYVTSACLCVLALSLSQVRLYNHFKQQSAFADDGV